MGVQEIILARSLIFFVGPMEISSDHLLGGIHFISLFHEIPVIQFKPPQSKSGCYTLPHILQAREDLKKKQPWSFDDLLFICCDRQATKADDKIFSTLGLVSDK